MRKSLLGALGFILAITLLTSCGASSSKTSPTPSPSVTMALFAPPTNCASTPLLGAVAKLIPGAKWIDTSWTPAASTDLEAIYSAGGIACSYGIAQAEVGGTFSWARNADDLYNSRVDGWKSAGQVERKVTGITADRIFVISDAAKAKMEIPSFSANVLINGFWIQIGGAFITSDAQFASLVKAAIASLVKPTKPITGCYIGKLSKDIYYLNILSQSDNAVTASIFYNTFEKDDSTGDFAGSYTNGVLDGLYTFNSEGSTSERELIFKGSATGFTAGYAVPDPVNGTYFFRPLSVTWEKQFTFLPATGCLAK